MESLLAIAREKKVKREYKDALTLFEKAAAEGSVEALVEIGGFFEMGRGTIKNEAKAWEIYTQAAKKKNGSALFHLAEMMSQGKEPGKSGKPDEKRAFQIYVQAADLGHADAQYFVGYKKQGEDREMSRKYLQMAANQGHQAAALTLKTGGCDGGLEVVVPLASRSPGLQRHTGVSAPQKQTAALTKSLQKPGFFGSTVAPTTEAELMALIKQDSGLSSKAGQVANWLQEQDWKSVVDTLKTSSISKSSVVVSLLNNVLGPISEAQGIAKAVIALAAAIVDMAMTAKANTIKCQKLAVQLNNVKPALTHLENSLSSKVATIMAAQPPTANVLEQFKREVESLSEPLKHMQRTAHAVTETIAEWTLKGTKLFGALRQMLTSKNYAGKFEDLSAEIAIASNALQMALSAMNFLNLNDVQQQLHEVSDRQKATQVMRSAAAQDKDDFSHQVKAAMSRDPQFEHEFKQHFHEISAELKSQFGDLFTYLDGEFHKVHGELKKINEKISSAPQLGVLAVKFDELRFVEDCRSEDFIGQGSFGVVYKCRWGQNKYAVKLLPLAKGVSKKAKTDIMNEALKMASVSHKNTVRLRGVCLDESPFCLVMDLVSPDLHSFVGDFADQLSWPIKFCMARELASGLEAVHDAGMIHGDVRSPNVMMGSSKARWCRVADFGLATTRQESSTSTTSTIRNTNNVWRAPELLLKPGAKFTKESDVWSYGCVLYEIATGLVPWANVSLDEVKSFYKDKQCLDIPDEVDRLFRKLISVCWQFNPKDRPTFRDLIKLIGNTGSSEIGF